MTFRPEAARLLLSCSWPLNVRELEKALAAAILLASGKPIDVEHLPPSVREGKPPLSGPSTPPGLREEDHQRRERILALVAQHHGNLTAVARDLGKARTQLQRWIKRYAIDLTRYRR